MCEHMVSTHHVWALTPSHVQFSGPWYTACVTEEDTGADYQREVCPLSLLS